MDSEALRSAVLANVLCFYKLTICTDDLWLGVCKACVMRLYHDLIILGTCVADLLSFPTLSYLISIFVLSLKAVFPPLQGSPASQFYSPLMLSFFLTTLHSVSANI